MIVSINQPAYLPWLGYFHRIHLSDVHIVLDHVQFEKGSVTARNKIRTNDGDSWLTVPVRTKGQAYNVSISNIQIVNTSPWAHKHLASMQTYYGRAPFFDRYFPFFERTLKSEWHNLGDLLKVTTNYLLEELRIERKIVYSSDLNPHAVKSDLILELCEGVGAKKYISGPFGRNYLDQQKFSNRGIEIIFHDYVHPVYKQMREPFLPFMSVIDLLFNHGENSMEIIKSKQS